MKKPILFLLLSGVLALGCGAGTGGADAVADAGADVPSDVGSDLAGDEVVGGPRIAFDETDVDVGHVAYSTPVTQVYRFRNAGDAALVLTLPLPPVEALEGC